MKRFAAILFFFIVSGNYSLSQIQHQWSVIHKPLNDPQNISTTKRDQLRLLSNGDIITGWTFDFYIGYSALGVTSYHQNGSFNWERYYYGSFGSINDMKSIEVDSADNVYLMGIVNFQTFLEDNAIIKYDSNGNQLWVKEDDSIETAGESTLLVADRYYMQSRFHPSLYRYDLSGTKIDTLGIDSISSNAVTFWPKIKNLGGEIYYGSSYATSSPFNSMLYAAKAINMDSIVWKTIIDVTPEEEKVMEIVPDKSGNLYMTALADRLSATDAFIFTCSFDSQTGDTLWTTQKHAAPGLPAYPSDIDVDNSGNVYVAGSIYNAGTMRAEAILIQYNAVTGQEKWHITMDSCDFYWADLIKISIDTLTKDVYFVYSVLPVAGISATSIAKIDSTGIIKWRALFNSAGSAESFLYDQNGQLFIAGGQLLSKFSVATGIDEPVKGTTQVSIFPNPAQDHFIISSTGSNQFWRIEIRNSIGQIFYQSNNQKINKEIKCNNWPSGIYFVNLYAINQKPECLKLIRQ
jgi:hypothetical protein